MKSLAQNPQFSCCIKEGKQALKSEHKKRVLEGKRRSHKCVQSMDFDACTTELKLMPKQQRWDYFIETGASAGKVLAVEVHPFKPSELRGKRAGTLAILQKHCPDAMADICGWHVIVTGDIRSDLAGRFSAETRIHLHRQLDLSKV
ncbi:hypothetical protein CK623_04950 [Vandammella animalimorsus]|uniref:Uncharacterized protein n=1 Tax=Vandammella animalimorsus TaxID=2029117 RepID=A0A2A2ASP3_9BURK|nr:hypothetical protein [Vandammella animalimorsus]PAT40712.1 hypothetical protein CK623_04950 [Vandammella animalimorsus]